MKFEYPPGATPIDPDEATGLIPAHLTLQRELNEYEEANILEAADWLFGRRRGDPLDERFIHVVHGRMFNQTWKWAGQARRSDKKHRSTLVRDSCPTESNARRRSRTNRIQSLLARRNCRSLSPPTRRIHLFPNGNGRHARLMADLLLTEIAGQRFEWGRESLATANDLRGQYIAALQAADAGDCRPLLAFLGTIWLTCMRSRLSSSEVHSSS